MECPNCNKTYDDNFKFCPYCGEETYDPAYYQQKIVDSLKIMKNHFDCVRRGESFNYLENEDTLNQVRSAIHTLSDFVEFPYFKRRTLLDYTEGLPQPKKMFDAMNSAMGNLLKSSEFSDPSDTFLNMLEGELVTLVDGEMKRRDTKNLGAKQFST